MTSISTPSVTSHQQTTRIRQEVAQDVAQPIEPLLSARPQVAPTVQSGAGSPATDAFLSRVFDILHKMHDPVEAAGAPALDAEDVDGMVSRIGAGASGLVTSEAFVAARPEHVTEEQAASLFASLDTDGRGVLSLDRLTAAIGETQSSNAGDALAALNVDGDLGVNREQFLASMGEPATPDDAVKTLLRLLGGREDEAQS